MSVVSICKESNLIHLLAESVFRARGRRNSQQIEHEMMGAVKNGPRAKTVSLYCFRPAICYATKKSRAVTRVFVTVGNTCMAQTF